MLDTYIRPWIDPALNAAGRRLSAIGVSANAVTLGGLLLGLAASACIAWSHYTSALALILASRILDGLDGAVARATSITNRGGYLDTVCDFGFYAAVPLGFALSSPAVNALPAAALLAAFTATCASFLGFAAIAAKQGLVSAQSGTKSFFYSRGLMEGTETIGFFICMCLWPDRFPALAWIFATLCLLTVLQRSAIAMREFRELPPQGKPPTQP